MDEERKSPEELAALFEKKWQSVGLPDMEVPDLLDLMDYYNRMGRDFEAELCRHAAERKDPDNPEIMLTRAHLAADDGDWITANGIRKLMQFSGYEDLLFKVEYCVRSMSIDQAYSLALASLPRYPDLPDYDFLYDCALLFRDFGYFAHSLRLINLIPPSYIDYAAVQDLKTECASLSGDYAAARRSLNASIDRSPFDSILWTRLAICHFRQKAYAETVEACEYALATSDSIDALRFKRLAALHLVDDETAKRIFDLAAGEQDFLACKEYGDMLFSQGRYEEAKEAYRQSGVFCPHDGMERDTIVYRLVVCLVYTNAYEMALIQLNSISASGLSRWGYGYEVAALLFDRNKHGYAVQAIKWTMQNSELIHLHLERLAELLDKYDCYEDARDVWSDILGREAELSAGVVPILEKARRRLLS